MTTRMVPGLERQDFPVCPHCGCEFHKLDEECVTDNADDTIECRACGLYFTVTTHVVVTYSTHDPKAEDDDEDDEGDGA